jgi:hypothetical protein
MVNFNNYKFRASSLGKIMVNGRSKSDPLSETTKTYLQELWIEEVYGRRKEISSKEIEKGNLVEDESIDLLSKLEDRFFNKNAKRYENEYFTGTPDIVEDDEVIDIKSPYDIWTFSKKDGNDKDYYWQGQCYMELTGKKKFRLAYVLTDVPLHLIEDEKRVLVYRLGLLGKEETAGYFEMEEQVEKNYTYSDIELKDRIKIFEFEYSDKEIEKAKQRVLECRDYLNKLSL